MKKEEIIDAIQEKVQGILEVLPKLKQLKSLNKDNLIRTLNFLNHVRLVEFITVEEAKGLIDPTCDICSKILKDAEKIKGKEVAIGLESGCKWHLVR